MWDRVFERVRVGLGIWGKVRGKEVNELRSFRDLLRLQVGEGKECAGLEVHVEEVLVLSILSNRLFMIMENEKSVIENGKLLPGIEAWIRMRKRMRKVVKELLAAYRCSDQSDGKSLAELMRPILELGEGVLEDEIERQSNERKTSKEYDGERTD